MIFKFLFIGIIVLADLAFVFLCLFATRTGMEAMGVLFILWPLAAFHIFIAGFKFFHQLWQKRAAFPIYFIIATIVMGYSYSQYVYLKPSGVPVSRILFLKTKEQQEKLGAYKEKKVLEGRQLLERAKDADHAELCRALVYPRDLHSLEEILKKGPDLSSACALIGGKTASPIFAVLSEDFSLWEGKPREKRTAIMENTRSTVAMLLDHGANPNSRDPLGNTPLFWALRYQDEQLAKLLLDHDACVFTENLSGKQLINNWRPRGVMKLLVEASKKPEMLKICPQLPARKVPPSELSHANNNLPDKWTKQLLRASKSGNLSLATQAIQHGADVNAFTRQGLAPLHLATKCRDEMPNMIELLLLSGADINGTGSRPVSMASRQITPLIAATKNFCPESVAILLQKGADPTIADRDGYTALHHIAADWPQERMSETVDLLIAAGADINARDRNGRTPLMMTAYSGKKDLDPETVFLDRGADPNLTDGAGNTFLHQLISGVSRRNPATMVASLIKWKAEVDLHNNRGMTPLMLAIKKQNSEIAKQLLTAGASVDQIGKRGEPLLFSVISCRAEKLALLDELLASGCNINICDSDGQTALHRALSADIQCIAPAERLLTAGIDPNLQDRSGSTALHRSIYRQTDDYAQIISLMVKHGADLDIQDQAGATPLLLAALDSTGTEILQELIEAGADTALTDNYGNTLLHNVAVNRHIGIAERVKLAIAVTSDLNKRNDYGKTALEVALHHHNDQAVRILEQAGAR